MHIDFTLNGEPVSVDVPEKMTLLKCLREVLGLTGTKVGCESGDCGACSVIFNGKLTKSCLLEMPLVAGKDVITIEGVHAPDGGPGDVQQAFLDHGAAQCGYCTPGMILAGEALLTRKPDPDREEIRRAISGNLCRCSGYTQIIDAIEDAARKRLVKTH